MSEKNQPKENDEWPGFKLESTLKCVKCGWKICCEFHFEEHIAESHRNIN